MIKKITVEVPDSDAGFEVFSENDENALRAAKAFFKAMPEALVTIYYGNGAPPEILIHGCSAFSLAGAFPAPNPFNSTHKKEK